MVTPVVKMESTPTPPTHKKQLIHVLHVDDEVDLLKTTKQILEMSGPFQVETASSVKEAMKKMEETEFDIIVSDYQMPEKDGLEFLRELRENENNIPLILFTGRGREEIAIKALNLGASRYCNKVGKPQTVYGELSYSIQQVVEKRKAEEALRQEQEMLETFTQNVGAGLTLISKDYHILWANQVIKKPLGNVEGQICYKTYNNLTHSCPGCGIKEILETGKRIVVHDQEVPGRNGEKINFEIIATPIRDKKGNISAVAELTIDVTNRKQAEKALAAAKNRFETYLGIAMVMMVALDAEGTVTYVNKRFCEVSGSNEEEIIGKNWFTHFIPVRIRSQTEAVFRQLMSGNIKLSKHYENPILTKQGKERIVKWRNTVLKDEKGRIIGTLSSGEDITENKKMEHELKQSEEKYRKQFEEALDAIFLADAETGLIVDCNRAATELVGRTKSELIGKHQRILHPPEEEQEEVTGGFKKHRNGNPSHVLEDQVITKKGEIKDVAIKASIFEVGNKRIMQGTFREITERKKIEKALRESAEKYRELINAMNDTAWVIDFDSKFIDVNDAAVKVLGYSRGELLAMGPQDIDNALTKEEIETLVKGMKNDEIQVFETVHTTKDGKKIPVEISSSIVNYQGKTAILSIARNITTRKVLENALQESEERFKQVAENAVEWIWEVDSDGLYTYSSPAVEKLLGYKPEEVIEKKHFYDLFPPEEQEKLKQTAFSAFKEKQPFLGLVNLNIHKNGKLVWLSTSGVPITDEKGKLVGYRGADVDITDRKKAEDAVDHMVNELEKVIEKLRVVGKATRHDARNKLSIIANNVYLAKQCLTGGHDASEYLGSIESAIGQINDIFDFARIYEMIGVEERSEVNVEKCFQEAVILYSCLGGTKLENKCQSLTVLADSQLRQLFYNLIDNSMKHGERVSKIRVYYEESKDLLKLIYEDDGVGISEAEKELIFREGYGKGTGYGLYLIQKICESYGWTIKETGKQGKGAQFTITIHKKNEKWKTNNQLQ